MRSEPEAEEAAVETSVAAEPVAKELVVEELAADDADEKVTEG